MFIGLDLGTSGVRALLVREDGQVVGEADSPLSVAHPHSGWSEQDPADWLHACSVAMRDLADQYGAEMAQVQGIGVSGQMHGATLLDEQGSILRPCILWNDTRSHHEAATLDAIPGVRETSGNIVFPGFTAPKLAWLQTHEPDIFARVAKVLLPKDFVVFWLTGRLTTDMSDASGTSWLDVAGRDWSAPLLNASGLSADQMPDLFEGCDVVGQINGEIARALGLSDQAHVVAGGADNASAACGVGALNNGDGFVSLGTSGVVLIASDKATPVPDLALHTFCHAVPQRWYQMGVILAATDSLNWLARVTGASPADLTAPLGDSIGAPGKVGFLPYLSGERTPHNDSAIRGAFTGLDIAHGRDDLVRAVLEGVAFALRDSLAAFEAADVSPNHLLAIGGGTGSRYWVELIATVLGVPLDLPEQGEFGAALGAARLAMCGATGRDPGDVMTKPVVAETIAPRAQLSDQYADAYARYKATYPALQPLG